MTPDALDQLLLAAQQPALTAPAQLEDALDRLEAAATAHPDHPALNLAFDALLRRAEVEKALPEVVAGIRRETLVRWTSWSSTWTGVALEDGRPVMVRAVDANASPRRARQLQRELSRLGLQSHQGVVVTERRGQPVGAPRAADPQLARVLAEGLLALSARPPTPALTPEELRMGPEGVHICCLAVGHDDGRDAVASLADALLPQGEGPLHDLLRGLAAHPEPPGDAAQRVVGALGRELAAVRHHLLARWTACSQGARTERLAAAVERLAAAFPPPRGRAAAGVDLEGQILAIASDEQTISFGPEHAMETLYTRANGLDAPMARRVLRAQAAAPPSPHLSRQVGGDAAFNRSIGRWIAAALRIRTLRLLLAQQTAS